MKIYEGTDGLRGLVKKLIEVYDFKKVVFEGDNASIDTKDATFQLWVTDELFLRGQFTDTAAHGWCDLRTEALTCPCVSITNYKSDKRRWIIYKQSDLVAIGIDNNTASRPNINIIIGEITNYETGETEIGMTTSCATNTIDKYAVFTNGMSVLSTPYRYFCQQKSVTSLTPVVSTSQNMALRRTISAEQFITVFTVVISFYFGTQYQKNYKNNKEDNYHGSDN